MFAHPLHTALCFCVSCTLLQTQEQPRCQATLQDFCLPARTQRVSLLLPATLYASTRGVPASWSKHRGFPEFFKLLLYFIQIKLLRVTTVTPSFPAVQFVTIYRFQGPSHYFDLRASCLFGSDVNGQTSLHTPKLVTIAEGLADFQACDWLGVRSTWCWALMLYLSWTFIVLKMIIAFPHGKQNKCHIKFVYKSS